VGDYVHIHENKRGGEVLSKALAKDGEMQWKIIEEETIVDHYTSKPQHTRVCTNRDSQQQT
jgi:hypothetical protein